MWVAGDRQSVQDENKSFPSSPYVPGCDGVLAWQSTHRGRPLLTSQTAGSARACSNVNPLTSSTIGTMWSTCRNCVWPHSTHTLPFASNTSAIGPSIPSPRIAGLALFGLRRFGFAGPLGGDPHYGKLRQAHPTSADQQRSVLATRPLRDLRHPGHCIDGNVQTLAAGSTRGNVGCVGNVWIRQTPDRSVMVRSSAPGTIAKPL